LYLIKRKKFGTRQSFSSKTIMLRTVLD